MDKYITYTTTGESSSEYCIRNIVKFAKKYAKKKWYQSKQPYLDEIKYYANILNDNEENKD